MQFTVKLGGNKRVDAYLGKFVIKTDQPEKSGGDESAPEPYSLFLASIGTCVGIYVVYFCEARKIPTEGIEIVQKHDYTQEGKRRKLTKISLEIHVPPSFPEKYHDALARAASNCAVKRTILDAPEFGVSAVVKG